jgi:hypothetical protein
VSYFRPQKTRKTGPRSTTALPPSTQELSQKGGRVSRGNCGQKAVSVEGFTPTDCAQFCAHHQTLLSATECRLLALSTNLTLHL